MALIDFSPLWLFGTNTYVVAPDRGGPAVVIDAPADPEGIGRLLAAHDLTPVAVLLTHGHIDHVGGVDALTGPTVRAYLHPEDVDMARHPAVQLRALLGAAAPQLTGPLVEAPLEPLDGGQTVTVADLSFEVLFTPGHSPGHCCFLLEDEGVLSNLANFLANWKGPASIPMKNLAPR